MTEGLFLIGLVKHAELSLPKRYWQGPRSREAGGERETIGPT